jgi:hypothetical protein
VGWVELPEAVVGAAIADGHAIERLIGHRRMNE